MEQLPTHKTLLRKVGEALGFAGFLIIVSFGPLFLLRPQKPPHLTFIIEQSQSYSRTQHKFVFAGTVDKLVNVDCFEGFRPKITKFGSVVDAVFTYEPPHAACVSGGAGLKKADFASDLDLDNGEYIFMIELGFMDSYQLRVSDHAIVITPMSTTLFSSVDKNVIVLKKDVAG